MSEWERVVVAPRFDGVTRAERRGGSYLRYHPDLIADRDTLALLGAETLELVADVQARLAALGQELRDRPVRLLHATLLREEGMASSWIEGIRRPPRDVVVARLGEGLADAQAERIAQNVAVMEDVMTTLRDAPWSHGTIHAIARRLEPRRAARGYRDGQVFIGGSSPLEAHYVAPPAAWVPGLMDDLLGYIRTNPDGALLKAAIVHAQFETIHPYEDGNGRTGRALVHGVLLRSGLVDSGVVPLSTALRADVRGYVSALQAYRYDAGSSPHAATDQFVRRFAGFVAAGVDIARETIEDVARIQARWQAQVAGLRKDATAHRALALLPDQPVITAGFLRQQLGVSSPTAQQVLSVLVDTGILTRAGGRYRRSALYQAPEVLALLERHAPGVQVSAPPESRDPVKRAAYRGARCGRLLPRKGTPCTLVQGHHGRCRDPR